MPDRSSLDQIRHTLAHLLAHAVQDTWPQAKDGVLTLTAAQAAMLTEGIDWRMPAWSARPIPERDA